MKDATTDSAQIEEWWQWWPEANIGFATGGGLLAVDVDESTGEDSLRALEEANGPLPVTVESRTGRGRQLFYRGDTRSSVGYLGVDLDVRGLGGYVVAPPSLHVTGKRYEWVTNDLTFDDLPPAPEWLIEANRPKIKPPAVDVEPNQPGAIGQGKRNATLASLAGTMRWRGMSKAAIEKALLADNLARCQPPLDDSEVLEIAESISRYPAADSVSGPVPMGGTGNGVGRSLPFRPLADALGDTPSEPEWLWDGYVAQTVITLISGRPKVGKSTFIFGLARALATGGTFLGRATKASSLLLLTEERALTLRAKALRFALDESGVHTLLRHEVEEQTWPQVVAQAVKYARDRGIGVLVVDTWDKWPAFHGDAENSAGETITHMRPLLDAAAAGLAVVIIAHQRKSGGKYGEAVRGSNALTGAVDVIVELERGTGPLGDDPSARVLLASSRFSSTPEKLAIALDDDTYTACDLDEAEAAADLEAVDAALTDEWLDRDAILARLESGMRKATLVRQLDLLVDAGRAEKRGAGKRGDPLQWRPMPPGGTL